ncbi:ABC transporter substrate-binding protein [Agromyces intestinalis]|uniref:ABC transporter substrate-binding protein n=1 Tax=Agromyces intestinalis TaxID=2592652 RepID=A0A5C1YIB5_9MICO|nr:ABC transporter substrate-binding protein [Agromyces intestinalis]QEO15348.1 ABC transporter substrate-binding protein [Agromyces intestinalis]
MPARRLTALAAAAAAALALAGCSSPAADAESGEVAWSYVSGDGTTYTADHVPQRIIAHAYAAKVLMEFGITPVGIYADGDLDSDVGLQGVDFEGIEVLGEEWGKIDVEKAASLQPDLIVGDWWPVEEAYSGLESGVEESSTKLAELAPVVGAAQGDSIVDLIEGYAELAESLGADTAVIDAQRAEFDGAVAAFQEAVAGKPGLTALAISPYDDSYAIAVPEYAPELLDLRSWGLDVIVPSEPDPDFPYWQTLSFENADAYQPDVLLFDDRNHPANEQTLADQPISSQIAAFAAGQTTTWPAYWLHTYPDYTAQLQSLTAFVEGANPDIVVE